jgi:hypothetical protein
LVVVDCCSLTSAAIHDNSTSWHYQRFVTEYRFRPLACHSPIQIAFDRMFGECEAGVIMAFRRPANDKAPVLLAQILSQRERMAAMSRLELALLGGFHAQLKDGTAIGIQARKTRALLAYLALPPGRQHTRETLVALLWSDRGEKQAHASLRQALVELSRALETIEGTSAEGAPNEGISRDKWIGAFARA